MSQQPTNQKEELFLCMGSACHQLGVYDVLPKLQGLLREHQLEETVELKGAFCLDQCANGISLKHRARIFTQVNANNLRDKFEQEILPSLKSRILPDT
ncbi:MAG: (2Fe-2S) ferredoxin domain-containing protein [Gemmataceae bacterium]